MALGAALSREMHQRVAREVVTGSPCGASSCLKRLPACGIHAWLLVIICPGVSDLRARDAVTGEASSSSEAAASTSRPVAAVRALMLGSVVVAQVLFQWAVLSWAAGCSGAR